MDKIIEKTTFQYLADHYIIRKNIGVASVVVALTPGEMGELCALYAATGKVESLDFPDRQSA